jgi:hypothetical protein
LTACGGDNSDDSDRSFAPEAQGDVALPTNTAAPTSTVGPLNRQPGESAATASVNAELFASTGPAKYLLTGIDSYVLVNLDDGKTRDLHVARTQFTTAAVSPDGKQVLLIDRAGGAPRAQMLSAKGASEATWSPPDAGTPIASPVAETAVNRLGDRIAWKSDGSAAVFAIAGEGVFLTDTALKVTALPGFSGDTVTAIAWSPSGQSIAIALWDGGRGAASIVNTDPEKRASAGTTILTLADGDGRFVRTMAWGSERVGLVFALRSATADFSLPNDLYMLPRFGDSMRLLASAGIAAPAAVIDQIAIASNGSTVAYTVLVPGQSGLRFHSAWATDALLPAPSQADTTGLRRISEINWSDHGLVAAGLRRDQSQGAAFQIAVVEQLSVSAPTDISSIRSDATPIGSPAATPVSGTPAATP